MRFATEPYSPNPNTFSNLFVHLTNYSINKYSENFIDCMEEDGGSKWTLTALLAALSENGIDVNRIMEKIEDIMIKTILSLEDKVLLPLQLDFSLI